ncbi:MAG: hypothetical protein ACREJ2_04035 [Planctomycetota bacterium]
MLRHLRPLTILSLLTGAGALVAIVVDAFVSISSIMAYSNPAKLQSAIYQFTHTSQTPAQVRDSILIDIVVYGLMGLGSIVAAGANFMAARSYMDAKRYRVAVFTAVLNLIPCLFGCCLLGIPVGIYALVVLTSPPVRELFALTDDAERRRRLARAHSGASLEDPGDRRGPGAGGGGSDSNNPTRPGPGGGETDEDRSGGDDSERNDL